MKFIDDFIDKMPVGPVCTFSSGGADSSLLLYLLMKYKPNDKIYVLTTGIATRQYRMIKTSANVVKKCVELTGNNNIEHHFTYSTAGSDDSYFSKVDFYFDNNLVNAAFTGLTANPPKEVVESFTFSNHTNTIRNVTEGEVKPVISKDGRFYVPFANQNKRNIFDIYKYEGLLDTLFPLTRSCEWEDDFKTLYNIEDPGDDGHCEKCWWCEERKWGFGRLE